MVVLKRCVDVDDLMATAAAGQADCAVVALDAPGLDATAVDHLRRHRRPAGRRGRGPVAAAGRTLWPGPRRSASPRWWPRATWPTCRAWSRRSRTSRAARPARRPRAPARRTAAARDGRVVAVWGPPGAPGRTTVAVGIAGRARPGAASRTVLVDADPYGGAVAQQLGVLDEVSGLLAAARLAGGRPARRAVRRASSAPSADGLTVVTGLPRPDRWVEVRPGTVEQPARGRPAARRTWSSTPASASSTTRPPSSPAGRAATG